MTRAEAFQKACDILDALGEREIEKYLAQHGYDPATEDELRCEVARWKAVQLAEIEQLMDAMARSMLH